MKALQVNLYLRNKNTRDTSLCLIFLYYTVWHRFTWLTKCKPISTTKVREGKAAISGAIYELPQQCFDGGWGTWSSSTTTIFRLCEFCRVSAEFCVSCSTALSIIFCVKERNISSIPSFNFADVWKCKAPTLPAYLK